MKPQSPGQYVLSVLQEFPDNELTAADLLDWQGEEQRFNKIAIYNALNHLHARGLVVKNQEGRATWWAVSPTGLAGSGSVAPPRTPRQPKVAAAAKAPATAPAVEPVVAAAQIAEPAPPAAQPEAQESAAGKPPVRYPPNRFRGAAG